MSPELLISIIISLLITSNAWTWKQDTKENLSYKGIGYHFTPIEDNRFGFEYDLIGTYSDSNLVGYIIETENEHVIENSFHLHYDISKIFSGYIYIPFIFKQLDYLDETGSATSLGDISFGTKWQLFSNHNNLPVMNLHLGYSSDSGGSPFKGLTKSGKGYKSVLTSFSISKSYKHLSPLLKLAYHFNLDADGLQKGYSEALTLTEVKPGDVVSLTAGFLLNFSERYHLLIEYNLEYGFQNKFYFKQLSKPYTQHRTITNIVKIGFGYNSPSFSIYPSFSVGYNDSGPELGLYLKIPYSF